ncbi:MYB-like transcription factor family protein [Quillaja saponaria]|uniref:MYB-like transcription factor family protein n=1 Tax=Quillaja saponaria TaxID=32244 RepID=A0AAD7LN31_QUISA|nr:MYB-like transcription factor family protein [Quillaja saponaria]
MKMEESHGSECSKTSLSNYNNDDQDECESYQQIEDESKATNGGSSSNISTVEENEKKQQVRPYVRSKLPRLRWTPDLHLRFVHAVQRLGGQDRATPKLVLQLMDIKGLSIAHVKSHLQMHRSKKIDDPNYQVLADHRQLVGNGDRNIYNLSQLQILQGYNPSSINFRYKYGDNACWGNSFEKSLRRMNSMNDHDDSQAGFYSRMSERIYGSNNVNWTSSDFRVGNSSSFGESQSTRKIHGPKQDECLPINIHDEFKQSRLRQTDRKWFYNDVEAPSDINSITNLQEGKPLKRKASDWDKELDLDLCLRLNSKKVDESSERNLEENIEVDSNLSLSLYSQSSSSNHRSCRLKEGNDNCKKDQDAKRLSTLDLTI